MNVGQANALCIDLQVSDYVAMAQFRHRLQARPNRRAGWSFAALVACMGLVMVVSPRAHDRVQGFILWGIMVAAYGYTFLYDRMLLPRKAKRTYLTRKYPVPTTTLEWDDTKVVFEDPVTRTTAPWAEMTRWLEDPKLFVMDFRGATLMYVPKRVLHGAVSEKQFRELLQAKIGPQGILRT